MTGWWQDLVLPKSFRAKIALTRFGYKLWHISHCVALKLALVGQFGHFQVGLHGFHCHVQLAAINISHKRTGLNSEYANDNVHLPKNPFGLIVNGLCFSPDNVFSIGCIQGYSFGMSHARGEAN